MRALLRKIKQLLKDRKFRKIWYRGVSTIGAVVVFVTTYALVLPAITMESEASCGIPAHQHSSECYEERLICGKEESDGHHHTDDCYTTTKELICELPEHKHDESCYDEEGNLTCKLSEHTHKEGCYEDHKELTCTLQESDGHHHDSSCYEQVLTCGREAHIHSTECYKEESLAVAASTSATASTAATAVTASAGEEAVNDSTDAVNTTSASDSDGTTFEETELSSAASHQDENGSGDLSDAATDQDPDENAEPEEFAGISAPAGTDINIGSDNKAEDKTTENADKAEPADNAEITDAATAATTGVLPEPVEQEELSDGYVPTLDPINMEQVLDRHTGFYYYHADETTDSIDGKASETLESSADITAWKKVNDDTKLAPTDLIKAYFAYTIPAGRLNETNQVARYRLPSNIHLTDDQIIAINQAVNGVAAAYVDQDTLQVADADNYNKYLGAEAVEGTRTPDENPQEGTQEYISAVVKAENVFDTEGIYGEKGAYLGQDIIFIFTPYSIEKNQHEYDADGTPVKAGEKIKGWFTLDFNMEQVDWTENFTEDGEEGQIVEKTADIIFASEDKSAGTKEIGETLTLVEETANEFDEDVDFDTDADAVDIDTTFTEDTSAALTEDTSADSTENAAEASTEDAAATDTAATASTEDAAKASTEEQSTTATSDKEYKDGTLTASGDGYKITLDYTAEAQIPEKASLQVREITAETDKEAYEACLEQAKQSVTADQDDNTTVDETATRFFDIEIVTTAVGEDGQEKTKKVEPKAPVSVNIQLDSTPTATDATGDSSTQQIQNPDPTVLHFAEDGVETLDATVDSQQANSQKSNNQQENTNHATADENKTNETAVIAPEGTQAIQFETSSFSIYGVVYTSTITKRILTSNGETYDISVLYEENAQIPANADLNVREITPDTAEYQDYLRQSADHLDAESIRDISYARFFDIEIVDENGNKIEPAAPVLVNIEYVDGAEIEAAKDLHVVHFADDGTEVLEGIGVNQDGTVMTYLQDGFSVTGTIVTNPAANDLYMVLIEYEPGRGNYYIVNNDGSLTKVDTTAAGTVDVDEPMMWTYDGKNIYHHSEQVSFNSGQLAADFYNKYIDPTDAADGISKDQDNSGTTLRNINESYFDWNTWSQRTFTYQVIQNRPQKNVTQITLEGSNIKSANSNQYLGVVMDADGKLRLVGGVSKSEAATVRLATANEVLKTHYLNHTVNHIDVSIEGEAAVDVPLAYGTYYDANGNEIKTVSSPESLHLDSGVVGITMDDMKRAIITAYTMDEDGTTHELDNAFTVSGYSANESTAYSTQQVRIEGDFRVANIDPVTKSHYDRNKSQVYRDRLAHKIYYKVTAYKTITFNLVDPELGQLYDEFGNPLKVSVDVAFSASFNYWDRANECPPLQWDGDWQKGGIPDHNLSGMDFVLGGNSDGDAESRAVEIIKIIEDENGSPIEMKTSLDHNFMLHYYQDATPANKPAGDVTNLRNQEQIWNIGSAAYNEYSPRTDSAHRFVDAQNVRVRVGTSGVGQSYTYDYNSGMFYITEDTKNVPDEIIGADGDTWYYASTVIETEYVRRYGEYDTDPATGAKNTHKSETYTDKTQNYDSRAEVLGRYNNAPNATGVPSYDQNPDNEFLEFTVHNVYRKSKSETTELNVTKDWEGDQPDDVTEVYVKVFRKTSEGQPEDVTGLIKADKDNLSLYVTRSNFDTENGWIVVHKTNNGWENVKVKSMPVKDNDGNNYTYYIQEVGYKQGSEIHRNVDGFTPSYTVQQGKDTVGADMGEGVVLLENTEANTGEGGVVNQFKVTNTQAKPVETSYTVTKKFQGDAYPTDGSAQVVMGLQRGYERDGNMVWEDAGVAPVTLPNINPTSDPATDVGYYSSEAAWKHTWDNLPATKKIGDTEYTLSYRAVEISASRWFDVDYSDAEKQVVVTGEGAEAHADPLAGTVTNKPETYDLKIKKQWTKDGKKIETWPENVSSVQGEIVKYWHVATVDDSTNPATITLSDAFKSEKVDDFTLSNGNEVIKDKLNAYEFRSIVAAGNTADDDLIVAAKQVGVTLEHGKTYLIVYTYGAKETQVNWADGKSTAMAQEISGDPEDSIFTATFTNDVTDISVKKEWRHESTTTPDETWPDGAVVNYKIMRVPVYTDADGKVTEFDAQEYIKQDSANYQGALESGHSQRDYTNLPTQGAEQLTEAKYGLQSGTYQVTYRYYIQEDPEGSVAPTGSVYQYTPNEAQIFHGVATLVNEYTDITIDKKWVRNGVEEPFPAGYKVNWKVLQKDSEGNVIDYYLACDVDADGKAITGEGKRDDRLTVEHGKTSFKLEKLPVKGVNADGKEVTYTYEVVEEPKGSEATADNPYLFQAIKGKEGTGENAGKFTIVNDLTKVTVKKIGDTGSSVTVQLYATTEKPEDLETVDIKVTLDEWGKDTLGQDRAQLSSGVVTGTLTGTDGSSRSFTLNHDNGWSQIFAGLPKKDADGVAINYTVENKNVSGVTEENKATYHSTDTAEDITTIHLQAEGSEEKVQFKFIKGESWPVNDPGWRLKIAVIDNDSGNAVWQGWSLGADASIQSGILPKGNYRIEYTFVDGDNSDTAVTPVGYTLASTPPVLTGNETGLNQTTIDLDHSVRIAFDLQGDWPTAEGFTFWYEVYSGTGWSQDGMVETGDTSSKQRVEVKLPNEGNYYIQYGFRTASSTPNSVNISSIGYSHTPISGISSIDNQYGYYYTGSVGYLNYGTKEIPINIQKREDTLPEGKFALTLSINEWFSSSTNNTYPAPTSGTVVFEIVKQNGNILADTVTLTGPDWSKQANVYLDKNTVYVINKKSPDNVTSIIVNGNNYVTVNTNNDQETLSIRAVTNNVITTLQSTGGTTRALRKFATILRANASHPDVTITGPGGEHPDNLTGEHKIEVIDKSNLPEDAVPVGGEVTLNQGVNWTKTWDTLPKMDANGKPIYYYVVEKKATTAVDGVTSTTATYEVEQDPETGEFTITIKNTTTTDDPKTGTIVVEKAVLGPTTDRAFKFSLRRASTGMYLNGDSTWQTDEHLFEIYDGQKYTFTRLPLGNYVLYEDTSSANTEIPGYVLDSSSVTGTAGSGVSVIADGTSEFTLKNVYTPAPIRVTKEWKNADGSTTAPAGAQVQFQLYKNGTAEGDPITLDGTPDEKGEVSAWVAEWKNMPRQDNSGNTISYTVKEVVDENGYGWEHYKVTNTDSLTYNETNAESNVIINEEQVTDISITKNWKKVNGEEETDPKKKSITYTLYQMYTDSVGEQHSVVFTQAKFKIVGSSDDPTPLTDGKGGEENRSAIVFDSSSKTWNTIKISNLPQKVLGEDGIWYDAKYYVVEDGIANVTPIYQLGDGGSDKPEDAAASEGTITIVNTEDSNSLRVEKTWDDLGSETPYELTFKVQCKERNAGDNVDWTDVQNGAPGAGTYKLVFNGSTYTITQQGEGGTAYTSNTIPNLEGSKRYRVVELSFNVTGTTISRTFNENEYINGTSTTPDNGLTWVSELSNKLEKVKIGGTKTWNDNKAAHADPKLILERTIDNAASTDAVWEKVTATKLDPTRPALAPAGEQVGTDGSDYTFMAPIWSTKEGKRIYTYKDLPKFSPEGKKYTYRVTEASTAGFTPTYSDGTGNANNIVTIDNNNEGTVNIINNPVGKLKVEKSWFAGADESQLQSVEFVIERNFDKNAATGWTAVANAPGFLPGGGACNADNSGKVTLNTQTTEGVDAEGNPTQVITRLWQWNSGDLPRFIEDPTGSGTYREVYYRVRETKVNEQDVASQTDWQVTQPDPSKLNEAKTVTLTIKNDKPQISISGTKTWVTNTPDNIPDNDKFNLKLYRYKENEEPTSEEVKNAVASANGSGRVEVDPAWIYHDETHIWNYAYTGLDRYYRDETSGKNLPWRYYVEEEITDPDKKDLFVSTVKPGQIMESGDIINYDFTNTDAASIKIVKKWLLNEEEVDGDPFDSARKVEVNLIQKKGAEAVSYGQYEIEKKTEGTTVKWELEINDLPKYYRDDNGDLQKYNYYVIELNTGIWRAEYSMTPEDEDSWTVAANQMDANGSDSLNNTITIRNSTYSYELPSTGGTGTRGIYFLGSILTMAAGLLLLLGRKRNKV